MPRSTATLGTPRLSQGASTVTTSSRETVGGKAATAVFRRHRRRSTAPQFVLAVVTCQKNLDRAEGQYQRHLARLDGFPIAYVRVIGDPELPTPWFFDPAARLLVVRCHDDYLDLPHKVWMLFAAVRSLFPDVRGVFKTDDDTSINLSGLDRMLRRNRRLDYYGFPWSGVEDSSVYLQDKPDVVRDFPEFAQHPVRLVPAPYCAGGGYFVSKRAVDILLGNGAYFAPFPRERYRHYLMPNGVFGGLHPFEDKTVGLVLNNQGIKAIDRSGQLRRAVTWEVR